MKEKQRMRKINNTKKKRTSNKICKRKMVRGKNKQ